MILPRIEWPKFLLGHPQLIGISYGKCIKTNKRLKNGCAAHAHTKTTSPHCGWICTRSYRRIHNELLMKHELAHLIAGEDMGHGVIWQNICLALGGTLNSYKTGRKCKSKNRDPNLIEIDEQ